jgi:soluble lytic murein transglycosylase-like protein
MKKTIAAACLAACVATGFSTGASANVGDPSSPLNVLLQEKARTENAAQAATTQAQTHTKAKSLTRQERRAARREQVQKAREARAASRLGKVASLETGSLPAPATVPAASAAQPTPALAPQAAPAVEAPVRTRHGKALGYGSEARSGLKAMIAKHAAANGIPFALADAVVRIESRYQPGVSNGGAVGLMQIKPQTARGLGYSGGAAGLKNPETNLTYGMKYLAQAYRMSGGSTCATVMRYQSGHYAKRINAANRAYCGKAQAIMASN